MKGSVTCRAGMNGSRLADGIEANRAVVLARRHFVGESFGECQILDGLLLCSLVVPCAARRSRQRDLGRRRRRLIRRRQFSLERSLLPLLLRLMSRSAISRMTFLVGHGRSRSVGHAVIDAVCDDVFATLSSFLGLPVPCPRLTRLL